MELRNRYATIVVLPKRKLQQLFRICDDVWHQGVFDAPRVEINPGAESELLQVDVYETQVNRIVLCRIREIYVVVI